MKNYFLEHSSYRDPSGFIFYYNDVPYRQINNNYKKEYDFLIQSGLFDKLTRQKLLIPHTEVSIVPYDPKNVYKTIKPEIIPIISYPYEWSFSQLKDAALTTLEIQKISMDYGMTLKDATAFNIQFLKGRPVFTDTLSFEIYQDGQIWKPYRQFCQHFLAPLALMSYKDIRLNQLLRIYIDGVPLDLASKLLPFRSYSKFSILFHIHMHAKSQKHYGRKKIDVKTKRMSKKSFRGLVSSLYSSVKNLNWFPRGTEWVQYYTDTNYSKKAFDYKKAIIERLIEEIKPKRVWDMGANTGVFSRLVSKEEIETVAFDIDPAAVEKNYLEIKQGNEIRILPLLLDLTNPSPGVGWECKERLSIIERTPNDTILALALIHHLIIENNLPFRKIAEFFSRLCKHLIIEFVPKTDSQVQRMLSSKNDIFYDYTKENFEDNFKEFFILRKFFPIIDSDRIIFYFKKNENE